MDNIWLFSKKRFDNFRKVVKSNRERFDNFRKVVKSNQLRKNFIRKNLIYYFSNQVLLLF